MALFYFNVTRPISVTWFTPVMIGLFIAYLLIITLVNIVAVGYESIIYTSFQYNATHRLWYDPLLPHRGTDYSHRQCEPAQVSLNDCSETNVMYPDCRHHDKQHVQLLAI